MVPLLETQPEAGAPKEPARAFPSTDVVVVGGGGAGLAVAVAAATRGVRTMLLEKRAALGGTTALSVGSICAAGTRLQRRRGIVDSADAFLEDMAAFDPTLLPRDAPALRALLAAEAGPTVAWLESLGLVFTGPYPEPPHRLPRMHNVVPGSRMYIACLQAAARRAGVTFLLGARAEEVLVDDRGRVVGVEYSHRGVRRQIRAVRGVVLASGDFSGDQDLRRQYLSPAATAAVPLNPANTGDGHRLAMAIGAEVRNMDVVFGPQLRFGRAPAVGFVDRLPTWHWLARIQAAFINRAPTALLRPFAKSLLIANMSPSKALFEQGAILVNLDGDRFCDERSSTAGLAHQRAATGYIVFDAEIAQRFSRFPHFISTAPGIAYAYFDDYRRGRPDLVHDGGSVAALAEKLRLDLARLDQAVAGAARPFRAPIYALGPVQSVLTVTEGGLAIDEQCRVLGKDGQPIAGLFAAGGVGQGGLQLLGHGLHIAWAMTSGRIAGAAAARAVPPHR